MACVLKATLSRASRKPQWVITAYAIFFGGVLLLGGALTSGLNWSWIFFLNVPIGVLLIGVSPVLLPEICAARRHRHLDIGGAAEEGLCPSAPGAAHTSGNRHDRSPST